MTQHGKRREGIFFEDGGHGIYLDALAGGWVAGVAWMGVGSGAFPETLKKHAAGG